jgi:ABC-type transport system substrate-binding protein
LVNRNNANYRQMALVLRQQLAEVGIGLRIAFYDKESELTPDVLAKLKPHLWLRAFSSDVNPSKILRSWYSFSEEFGKQWRYQNLELDRLFEATSTQNLGPQEQAVYQRAHEILYQDQSAAFLFFLTTMHAVSAQVENTDSFFTPRMPDYVVKDWYLSPKKGEKEGFIPKERR